MPRWLKPIRPQVSLAILVLGALAGYMIHEDPNLDALNLVVGGIVGITGTLIGVDHQRKNNDSENDD